MQKVEAQSYYQELVAQANTDHIRKDILDTIAKEVSRRIQQGFSTHILFVCTHNSRRSQACELWGSTFIDLYELEGLEAHSCGTEKTTFNYRMVDAARKWGFQCTLYRNDEDEVYGISPPHDSEYIKSYYSKIMEDKSIPKSNVVAIMTCDHASMNCPIVPGASLRFNLEYQDPGKYDGSEKESEHYNRTFSQIGVELAYLFKKISDNTKAG